MNNVMTVLLLVVLIQPAASQPVQTLQPYTEASGVYFCTMRAGNYQAVKKLLVVK